MSRFANLVEEVRANVPELEAEELKASLERNDPLHLIDVREDHEWEEGHIPGARHIGRGILERDIEKSVPEPDTPLILYCGGGSRSVLAAENLQRMGYTNVKSLRGGFSGWKKGGYSVAED